MDLLKTLSPKTSDSLYCRSEFKFDRLACQWSEKKETLNNVYFIHSMCSHSVTPCWSVDDRQKTYLKLEHCVRSPPASEPRYISKLSDFR